MLLMNCQPLLESHIDLQTSILYHIKAYKQPLTITASQQSRDFSTKLNLDAKFSCKVAVEIGVGSSVSLPVSIAGDLSSTGVTCVQ